MDDRTNFFGWGGTRVISANDAMSAADEEAIFFQHMLNLPGVECETMLAFVRFCAANPVASSTQMTEESLKAVIEAIKLKIIRQQWGTYTTDFVPLLP